jgi:hypothetical protein
MRPPAVAVVILRARYPPMAITMPRAIVDGHGHP